VVDVEHHPAASGRWCRVQRGISLSSVSREVALVVRVGEAIHDRHAVDLFVVGDSMFEPMRNFEDRVADLQEISVPQAVGRDLVVVHVAAVRRAQILYDQPLPWRVTFA